ncbi:MAG: transcriptional regulator [Luteolibacter sp.]|uniref:helix-turn-helix domain-containing protein n=1 Tax=Luteolibacter sp. TaxID=1962973 RepID=UPI0032668339
MKPGIIKNDEMHEKALALVESLMDAEPGSEQEGELELWSLLIEQYEKEHYPISAPDPIEAIHFRMDQLGLRQKDLEEFIGQKSKVSEVMNRKRPLSLPMIRSLSIHLGIPAAVLVRETPLSPGKTGSSSARKRRPAAAS